MAYGLRAEGAPYRGRFAPSPTGDLHFGSLVVAVGSYLAARSAGGEWCVRVEDLDTPRVVPGSADRILKTLDALGFEWTGPVLYQSTRFTAYRQAVEHLLDTRAAFFCSCSRREIQAAQLTQRPAGDEPYYPGWCRAGVRAPDRDQSVRFRVSAGPICFEDELQGSIGIDLATDAGDFVVRRRDGLFAYQLAVVLDDAAQRITHVVRGADLLNSTPRQIALQRALDLRPPMYAHLPLVTDENGIKLSKSAGAGALDLRNPSYELWRALRFLRQKPPLELRLNGLRTVWDWAIRNWNVHSLRGILRARAEML